MITQYVCYLYGLFLLITFDLQLRKIHARNNRAWPGVYLFQDYSKELCHRHYIQAGVDEFIILIFPIFLTSSLLFSVSVLPLISMQFLHLAEHHHIVYKL
ncbi:hypothetical protein WOLCODRAFT_159117 [Wolfiporia cocos MD-104 SS10]|uniref:Uncharacterized protein n=1 Tax=Wolfiporia cocos (strain MD-104) TaxID=742152 RepID=A0A2H3JS96_WOLCO|nr:hypothetical protein WOLCODRAFT_159117 [Wolfiporia cocos MD-104 SS10]